MIRIHRIGTHLNACVSRRATDHVWFRLADRKQIERAKGIVMKHRRIGENEAFALLRKQAMDRNLPLGQVAEQMIVQH